MSGAFVLAAALSASTVAGRVVDAAASAPIAGALVRLAPAGDPARGGAARVAHTDAAGLFAFPGVPAGAYTLTVSLVGYRFSRRDLHVPQDVRLDLVIPLAEGAAPYRETVSVTAQPERPPDPGVASHHALGPGLLQELRSVSTDDPLRALQALPGAATGDDFQAEFSVRGSAFRHVGVVIDGTPAPVLLHAVRRPENPGSLAVVNTDVLARASLTAGPHPRRHGDWLGATVELETRDGSRDRASARLSVSGTAASLLAEGPTSRARRGSWLVSVRRSYFDWLIRRVEPGAATVGFWDGHVKAVQDLTPRQQVEVLVIGGDASYAKPGVSRPNSPRRAASGSALASVAWRLAGPRALVSQRLSFLASEFNNHGAAGHELARGYTQAVAWRGDVLAPLGAGWTLEAGARRERQRMSETLRHHETAGAPPAAVRTRSAATSATAVWAQLARRTDRGGVSLGARLGTRTPAARAGVSPWLVAERRAGAFTWYAGAGASAEFPDPLAVFPAEEPVRPERARTVEVAVSRGIAGGWRWQAAWFRRSERDVVRPAGEAALAADGTPLPAVRFPLARASLRGDATGVDVSVRHRAAGGGDAWLGYTWARARMRDEATGERFDADADQRHTVNAFLERRLSWRATAAVKLRVGSGMPLAGYFAEDEGVVTLAALRNRVRLPVYARLDVRLTRTFTFDRRRLSVFVEVLNALGRRNIGQAAASAGAGSAVTGYAERLVPRMPSAGFVVEF